MQTIKKILETTGNSKIMEVYNKTQELSSSNQNLLVRTISNYFVNRLQKLPEPKIRRRIATAIMECFVGVFERDALLPSDTSKGKLGNCLRYCSKSYNKRNAEEPMEVVERSDGVNAEPGTSRASSSSNRVDVVNAEPGTSRASDFIDVLMNSNDHESILKALTESAIERRRSILSGSRQYMMDLFFRNPSYIVTDFDLHFGQPSFEAVKDTIFKTVDELFQKQYKDKKNFIFTLATDTQPYGKMLILLYGFTKGRFFEAFKTLVDSVDSNCSTADLLQTSRMKQQPFIIKQQEDHLIAIDGRVMCLPCYSFDAAFAFLFKLHHVWNIEYPKEINKLYLFIDSIAFKITKEKQKSLKVVELVAKCEKAIANLEVTDESDSDTHDDELDVDMESGERTAESDFDAFEENPDLEN